MTSGDKVWRHEKCVHKTAFYIRCICKVNTFVGSLLAIVHICVVRNVGRNDPNSQLPFQLQNRRRIHSLHVP